MRYPYKLIAAILILFVTVSFTSSCGVKPAANPTAAPFKEEQITISFMSHWGGNNPYRDLIEQTIADFMSQNPDIKVVNESLSQGDYLSKLKTNFATGYIPDVFVLWPGPDLEALITSGQVTNLKEIMTADWEKLFQSHALETYIRQSGLYGLPFDTVFLSLYVNTRILSENDIAIPRTYDQLLAAIPKLNRSGVVPIAYSGDLEGTLLYQSIIANLCEGSSITRDKKIYIEAMEVMKELYNINAFSKNAFIMSGYEQNKQFLSGDAAMIVQGSWFSGDLDQMKDPVAITHFPVFGLDATRYNVIGQNGYSSFHVSSKALEDEKTKEAVKRFLTFFTSKTVAMKFVEQKGMISAVNLPAEIYDKNPYAANGLKLIQKCYNLYKFPSEYFGEQVWSDVFIKRFPYVLENRLSPEGLMESIHTNKSN